MELLSKNRFIKDKILSEKSILISIFCEIQLVIGNLFEPNVSHKKNWSVLKITKADGWHDRVRSTKRCLTENREEQYQHFKQVCIITHNFLYTNIYLKCKYWLGNAKWNSDTIAGTTLVNLLKSHPLVTFYNCFNIHNKHYNAAVSTVLIMFN